MLDCGAVTPVEALFVVLIGVIIVGMPWFRMYSEMIDDPKVGTLDDAQFRLWVEFLCLACEAGNGGDTNLTVTETGWKLRRNVSVTLQELLQRGLVTLRHNESGKETVFINKWKFRQFQSDTSTPRVQKHREKQKGNVAETLQESF